MAWRTAWCEVDEDVTPQQLVELVLADRVQHAEPLEHADLGVPVVVDVHRRVIAQAARGSRRSPSPRARAPASSSCAHSAGSVHSSPARESSPNMNDELAVGTPERIALEVDRQIEPRGLGKSLEPPALLGRLHELGWRSCPLDRVAACSSGLLVQRRERPGPMSTGVAEDRVVGQRGERRDPRGLERHGLRAPDPRDVREVVAARHCASQSSQNPHISQAAHGTATVTGGASTKRSSERCARAKYASKSRGRSDSRRPEPSSMCMCSGAAPCTCRMPAL